MSIRTLFYNWVDYLDPEKRGGGVTVYQRNLMTALDGDDTVDATFLSSGVSHDMTRRAPYWRRLTRDSDKESCPRYEIVNSGTLAPAMYSYGAPEQISHAPTREAFADFVEATGPYDVIHFHNLEGLPADVLELKTRWPETKFVFSLHNYYPICPQVNLWYDEREACDDFHGGARCLTCANDSHDPRIVKLANGLAFRFKQLGLTPGTWMFDTLFLWSLRIGGRAARLFARLRRKLRRSNGQADARVNAEAFRARRERMTALINAHCDLVLCVSEAVREIAQSYGIAPEILRTSYIGTQAADLFEQTAPAARIKNDQGVLTLAFLGYMRRDKGFFFLLDWLENMPRSLTRRLHIVIAARKSNEAGVMRRVSALSEHCAKVSYHDGYSHDELDEILAPADVGILPVLWHDNMPQVAIEMHARHIPLLTSDMGGAQELGRAEGFVFEAGNHSALQDALERILSGETNLSDYWKSAQAPTRMQEHCEELEGLFETR